MLWESQAAGSEIWEQPSADTREKTEISFLQLQRGKFCQQLNELEEREH